MARFSEEPELGQFSKSSWDRAQALWDQALPTMASLPPAVVFGLGCPGFAGLAPRCQQCWAAPRLYGDKWDRY